MNYVRHISSGVRRYQYMSRVLLVVLAACTVEPDLGQVAQEAGFGGMQGRPMLGAFADTLGNATNHYYVTTAAEKTNVSGTVYGTAAVIGGHLIITTGGTTLIGDDPAIVGWKLLGPAGTSLTITDAVDSQSNPDVTQYNLRYDTTGADYCNGGKAVPFGGLWQKNGLHDTVTATTAISFGCYDAGSFKCVDWGYVPGSGAWDVHQACTRMARADYCATGSPHTRDGTEIEIYDDIPSSLPPTPENVFPPTAPWPPPTGTFYFEAAWRGGSLPPVCLSRLRWQSIPLDGCPGMSDPRTHPKAQFCDDMTVNQMAASGALTYNSSKFNDLGMHRWHSLTSTNHVTTTRGYVGTSWPFSGVTGYDGLDGILIRSLPASIDRSLVVEVHAYSNGPDHLVTKSTAIPPGRYSDLGLEGYIFIAPHPSGTSPLYLYTNGTGDYTTSTTSPASGYGPVTPVPIGHVWN